MSEGESVDSDGDKESDHKPAIVESKESEESDDEIMKPVPKDKQFWDKDEILEKTENKE